MVFKISQSKVIFLKCLQFITTKALIRAWKEYPLGPRFDSMNLGINDKSKLSNIISYKLIVAYEVNSSTMLNISCLFIIC